MITSKLTIASLFVATLAWAGLAKAEDPCGAPSDLLESCEAVAAPECHDVCQGDAMITSCMADGAAACMDECAGAQSIECEAGCMGSCETECAQALVSEEPKHCEIMCSASCMGSCSASCTKVNNKVTCHAACSQQCSAHCSSSCGGGSGGDGAEDEEEHEPLPPRAEPEPLPPRAEPEPLPPRLEPQKISELIGDVDGYCQRSCAQACTGSCAAEVARDCELPCQAKAAESCTLGMSEECHADCDDGGVLACNGQYMNVDDVDACLTDLERKGLEVGGPIEALRGGSQELLERRTAACSVQDEAKLGLAGALFMVLSFGLGVTVLRRR